MIPNKKNKLDLMWQFTRASFKMRYQNSLLGVLWVLIKPYTTFVVMYFLWSQREGAALDHYGIYLLLGIVFYTFFNELMVNGNMALLEKQHVILKANFSRQIAIISSLFSALINLGINLFLVFVIMILSQVYLSLTGLLYLVFLIILIFTFGMAMSMFTSIINVRFRDLKNIFELGMFLLYWISVVVFVPESFTGLARTIIDSNPVAIVLTQVRASFDIYGQIDLGLMLMYFVFSVVLFCLGWIFFSKHVKSIAEFI